MQENQAMVSEINNTNIKSCLISPKCSKKFELFGKRVATVKSKEIGISWQRQKHLLVQFLPKCFKTRV